MTAAALVIALALLVAIPAGASDGGVGFRAAAPAPPVVVGRPRVLTKRHMRTAPSGEL